MAIMMTNAGSHNTSDDHMIFQQVTYREQDWIQAGPYGEAGFPWRGKAYYDKSELHNLPGVTGSDIATVVFSLADAKSGNFAPICETFDDNEIGLYNVTTTTNADGTQSIAITDATSDGEYNAYSNKADEGQKVTIAAPPVGGNVYIYAAEKPTANMTVPVIMITRNFVKVLDKPVLTLSGSIMTITSGSVVPDGRMIFAKEPTDAGDYELIFQGALPGNTLNLNYYLKSAVAYNIYAIDYKSGYADSSKSEVLAFNQSAKTLTGVTITLTNSLTYNGGQQQQIFSVSKDGEQLQLNADYTIGEVSGLGSNLGTDAGNYTLTINGTGLYSGSATQSWSIAKADCYIKVNTYTATVKVGRITFVTEVSVRNDSVNGTYPTVTATSANASIATASIQNGRLVIGGVSSGMTYVTLSAATNTNFNAPTSVQIAVCVNP